MVDDDEAAYDTLRLRQWQAGAAGGFSRRTFLALAATLASAGAVLDGKAASAAGPILKPLPPELFTVFGSNAEMRWSAMSDQGYLTPVDRFFVRDQHAGARRRDLAAQRSRCRAAR